MEPQMNDKKYHKGYVRMSSDRQKGPRREGKQSQVGKEKLLSSVAAMAVHASQTLSIW